MKIIVDPDFPNSQLFVDIIHQVANRYMDRMIHQSIIAGKLATAQIHLHLRIPTEEDIAQFEGRRNFILSRADSVPRIIYERTLNETVYDTLLATGCHQAIFENNHVYSVIHLYAVPSGSLREFANVVAHEMTHMLVCESHNYYSIGNPLECGTMPFGSRIRRWDPERNITYGHKMEEIAVHTVGTWLVKDLPLPADPENEALYCPEEAQIALCNRMADAFGTPLDELQYLDEFSATENGAVVPNLFWYAFAVNQFDCIISAFNEVMGDGAYEDFCRLMEYGGSDQESQANANKEAEEMLTEFARRTRAGLTAADCPRFS